MAWAPLPIVLSAGLCTLVGLAFSVYPARQAATLDPIEAIRSAQANPFADNAIG